MNTTSTKRIRDHIVTSLLILFALSPHLAAGEAVEFASGARQLTLVELYTSQGCSSCPPAEQWLGQLKEDPRLWRSLIPVAFHVDYWDYLGWRDTLAQSAYAQRQRRYQQEGKLRTVYTPAFVVNGEEWRSWFGLRRLPETQNHPGILTVRWEQGVLHARFTPGDGTPRPLLLHVAVLGVGISTSIHAGENSGRILMQDFAVLDLHQQRSDQLKWTLPLPLPPRPSGGRLAMAAWVSPLTMQGPLQATGGWLPLTQSERLTPQR